MATLNNIVKIYVPSTTDGNKPARLAQRREAKRAAKFLCSLYGGATATTAEGYYLSDSKGLIKEKQRIIYAYCIESDRERTTAGVTAYVKRLCKRMRQESVTLEINGTMKFIEGTQGRNNNNNNTK